MLDSQPESRARLGYCPQVDPLLDLLTAREQLAMFARLKVSNKFLAQLLVSLELVLSSSQNGSHLSWSYVFLYQEGQAAALWIHPAHANGAPRNMAPIWV